MPCRRHTWNVRIDVERLLGRDGFASGWFVVNEHKHCTTPGCDAFQVERIEATRSRSADESLARYRRLCTETTS